VNNLSVKRALSYPQLAGTLETTWTKSDSGSFLNTMKVRKNKHQNDDRGRYLDTTETEEYGKTARIR